MNEPAESKQSMERAMVEATGLVALGVVPALSSSFKVRGHDRETLGHDVGPAGLVYRFMAGVERERVSRDHG